MLLCALLALSGCGAQASQETSPSAETSTSEQAAVTTGSTIDATGLFSDRDLEGTYDESAAIAIQLSGDSAACDSDTVTIEGSRVTIGAEGVYVLSGTLTDGQIVVNAGETDKVQLVLAGADITSSTSAAIYALEGDKVFVTLAEVVRIAQLAANETGGVVNTVDEFLRPLSPNAYVHKEKTAVKPREGAVMSKKEKFPLSLSPEKQPLWDGGIRKMGASPP